MIIFIVIFIILYFINNIYINRNFSIDINRNFSKDSSLFSGVITKENFNTEEYKKLMLNNNKKNLYKISLDKNIEILREECYDRCNKQDCEILDDKTKWFKKCMECNIQDKKCFNKSIIGGNCDDCNIDNIEDKINCFSIENYGCPNPNNLNDLKINSGILPYYIEVPDNNVNSPFNKKCVFCWNLMDNI